MKICYITAQVPWGRGETFIIDEMLAIKQTGIDFIIIPRNPTKEVFHSEANSLLENAIWLPLISPKMIINFLFLFIIKPKLWKILGTIIYKSRSFRILIKNIIVMPKGVYISSILKRKKVQHIHAHWGSTTATMAWITSELTGIPWSFTLHRWDISENNMLKLKIKKSAFVRCISEDGRKEVIHIVGEKYKDKIKVLYMGVHIPKYQVKMNNKSQFNFVIACPANLVVKKGHQFLIEACALLVKWGISNFECLIIGDGPLREIIRRQVIESGLEKFVKFLGHLSHEKLLKMYEEGKVNVVVLPSIVTEDKEKEGIPVSLMEAMAYGIPVISTNTGGIPELLKNDAGILIEQKSSIQLAEAILKLIRNPNFTIELSKNGYLRVKNYFNLSTNVSILLSLFKNNKRV